MAIVGFLSPLSVAVFGPACGRLLDLTPRRPALRFITAAQTGAIATGGKPAAPALLHACPRGMSARASAAGMSACPATAIAGACGLWRVRC